MEWIFEPGHTAAHFRVKHMMVTWVRGQFYNVKGFLNFDPEKQDDLSFTMVIDANLIDSGVEARDTHLKSADFLDVENHPKISFQSKSCKREKENFIVDGDLKIRGIVKPATVTMQYIGKWATPFWTEKGHQGNVERLGFTGHTTINRHDFSVDWNSEMDKEGIVVGKEVHLIIDIEGILKSDLERVAT